MAFTISSFLLLNIDRSRSVYLIKWVGQSQEETLRFDDLVVTKNLAESDAAAIRQRIDEQSQIKFIYEEEQTLHLTVLGKTFYFLANSFAKIYNLQGYKEA